MTSKATLKRWFDRGRADPEISHMIVKWDTFEGPEGDYPLYVRKGQDPREVAAASADKTIECYSMSLPWETQADETRANHWDAPLAQGEA